MINWPWNDVEKSIEKKIEISDSLARERLDSTCIALQKDIDALRFLINENNESGAIKILNNELRKSQKIIMSNREKVEKMKSRLDFLEHRLAEAEFWKYEPYSLSVAERIYFQWERLKIGVSSNILSIVGTALIFLSTLAAWWLVVTNI